MTVPLWRCESRSEIVRCDTAILGGGITGLGAAIALQRRGIDGVLIERGEIASGASGRNAGYLMRGAADNYAAAVRDWGRDAARSLWRWTEENLAMLRAEGIESAPNYRRVPSCLLALSAEEESELRESHRLLEQDGFKSSLLESGTDAAWRAGAARAGLLNPDDAACNPCDLLRFLAFRLDRPPLTHTEVARIECTDSGIRLISAKRTIEAVRCIVALNAYAPLLFPALHQLVRPRRGQILAVRTRKPEFDYSYYANHGYEYFRQVTDTTAIIGGWRKHFADEEVGYEDRVTDNVQRGLESFALKMLAQPLDVTARWSGTMGFTPDGLPLLGPIDETGQPAALDSPIWICGGYTGHGMSMAFKAAHEIVNAMLNRSMPPFPLTRELSPG